MPVCSFCKKNYKEPRGLTIFTFDGKSVHFCSSKCQRNTALKRDPRKVNWVKRKKVKGNETVKEKVSAEKSESSEKVEDKTEKSVKKE